MALTYPRAILGDLCFDVHEVTLRQRQELSMAAGGPSQVKDLGPPVWQGNFQTYPIPPETAYAFEATLQDLGGVMTFHVWPKKRRPGPQGVLSDNAFAGVTISEIRSDFRGLKLSGLPANATLSAGDFLSVATPVAGWELLRLTQGGDASGSGDTDWLDTVNPIRPMVTVGATVALVDPIFEALLVPGSLQFQRHSLRRWRVGFEATQVIR